MKILYGVSSGVYYMSLNCKLKNNNIFLLKFIYITIYQYIILNILSTKLSTKSLLTLYKLSTKIV